MKRIIILLIALFLLITGCAKNNATTFKTISSSNLEYYFTRANQHPDKQLIKVIDSSTKTLDIAIYSITEKEIVNSIITAKKRKVDVRIMTDRIESQSKAESKELVLLKEANIPIKINSHTGLLHIKMTIADKSICTTGSYNYTENATKNNDEVLMIINDSNVAKDFDSEFENMWNNSNDYEDYN